MIKNTLPTQINQKKLTEYMDMEYQQCEKDQFLREFWKNGEQAILRYMKKNPTHKGKIKVCYRDIGGVKKLCIIDNGVGMTANQLEEYIRDMACSHEEETDHPNFGVGSKISAAPLNHFGIVYESWTEGNPQGTRVKYGNRGSGEGYGILRLTNEGGNQFHEPILANDPFQSKLLAKDIIKDHGTIVTFLGNNKDCLDDTSKPEYWDPNNKSSAWLLSYFNKKISYINPNIDLTVPGYGGKVTKINGLNADSLAVNTTHNGIFTLSDGSQIEWYILRPFYKDKEANKRNRSSGAKGAKYTTHSCIIVEGETYKYAKRSRLMRDCGITFYDSIILHFHLNSSIYTPNKYRTDVIHKGKQTTGFFDSKEKDIMCKEFSENLPKPIQDIQDKAMREARKNTSDNSSLEKFKHLYVCSKTTVEGNKQNGADMLNEQEAFIGGGAFPTANGARLNKNTTLKTTPTGCRNKKGHKKSTEADNLPKVLWTDDDERHTETVVRLADRAGEYDRHTDIIFMNHNYGLFADTLKEICKNNQNGWNKKEIEMKMRQNFGVAVSSHVMYQRKNKMKNSWTPPEVEQSMSPESLTAVVNATFPFIIEKTQLYIQDNTTVQFQKEAISSMNGVHKVEEVVNGQAYVQ